MLHTLDYILSAFHIAFVLFILFGWISPKTRKAHVTALLLMVMSWMLLGLYKGKVGYCLLTDLHWDIKRALGESEMPSTFIEYLIIKITGINFSDVFIEAITGLGLVFSAVMAAFGHRKDQLLLKAKEKKHHLV